MYRQTKRSKELRSRMGESSQKAQHENRLESPYNTWSPPQLRRVIIIIDYDSGEPVERRMELRRSNRVDCYDCYINGELWKSRIGWSRCLEWIRKAFPRIVNI